MYLLYRYSSWVSDTYLVTLPGAINALSAAIGLHPWFHYTWAGSTFCAPRRGVATGLFKYSAEGQHWELCRQSFDNFPRPDALPHDEEIDTVLDDEVNTSPRKRVANQPH